MHSKCLWKNTTIQRGPFWTLIVGKNRLNFDGGDPSGQSDQWFSGIGSVEITWGLTSRENP